MPELAAARFVVYVRHRTAELDDRRIIVDRAAAVTTEDQAHTYVHEFLGDAWEIGTILPIVESNEVVHVLDALDEIRATTAKAAPLHATIPTLACPGGVACQCHDEGLD